MAFRGEVLRVGGERTLLVDGLPVSVEVNGRVYPFRWDFRCGILLTALFFDERLAEDAVGRVLLAVKLFSPSLGEAVERGEVSLEEAFSAVAAFYGCGREWADGEGGAGRRVMDFDQDGERILAAFRQVYGIDLCALSLHWWTFTALLRGLPADCPLMGVIRLRGLDTTTVSDDETRRKLRLAKAAVRIRKNGKDGMTR